MRVDRFDPAERARAKASERNALDDDLASGRVSPEEMQHRNSVFANVDFSKARIVLSDTDPEL
ncbi:hypothetical protein [Sphingosinicella sp. BN140058]|uniref:hypothetical protein n=1 Tax=Sphingosinicella sp. BN140058 TaxID=1892855 RepID=UPI001012BE90|nr:hypothetical protein [Sphingosinicella sp. BN140058]QAY80423.1 hypothetical protein ETR14_27675 [Sphingosinicella sp. BN140058]